MAYEPPEKGRPFIAYEKKARAVAGPDGQTVRARPSVYVREHVGVRVSAYKVKTKATDDGPFRTGRVTFDAESVGLEHDFHGSVQADSKAAELLAEAFKNDLPVTVAIETTRRYKQNDSGEVISPLTPIHELRGIVGDSKRANAEITNRNCRNLVVAVNGEFTGELVSDPEEWESLRDNRDGTLAPDGYAVFGGAVIPAANASHGTVDVSQQVRDELRKFFGSAAAPASNARPGRPAQQAAHAAEAKPWEEWNTDGRFNHGSYLATAIRETYAQAHQMAVSAGVDLDADATPVGNLAELLLGMADRIQLGVYRHPDGTAVRSDRSHHEARAWIDFVVSHLPEHAYTSEMADPNSAEAVLARNAWASKVIATVSPLMSTVARVAETDRALGPDGIPVLQPVAGSDAFARFKILLGHKDVGLAGWHDRVFPLLTDQFGTHDLHRIELARFLPVLAQWEAEPAAFLANARASAAARKTAEADDAPDAEAA
ncbi:hypothetical protein [Streptomyces californicus]|uniref:hypothetical protein n=1 Tax=Streptomyces californicus TaxID=67351 RepID=UPI00296FE55E|nr:hypothetical protein [Streptomyces californicus]MDW4912646.1 hypothetical protein [Streptomyces californicus]